MGECSCIQQELDVRNKYFGCGKSKEEAFLEAMTDKGFKYRYTGRSKIGLNRYYPSGSLFFMDGVGGMVLLLFLGLLGILFVNVGLLQIIMIVLFLEV